MRPIVEEEAALRRVPNDLVYGVIYVESRFNPEAVSPVGARGLMQLMPGTARYLAGLLDISHFDCFDPEFNVKAGTFYLSKLLDDFDGDETLALAAYNAGATNVKRWLARRGDLPDEVSNYALAVQAARLRFRESGAAAESEPDDRMDRSGLASLIRRKNQEALAKAEGEDLSALIRNLEDSDFRKTRPDRITLEPSP